MAERAVLGDGPIQFTNRNGRQLLIPLTALYFDARGALKLDHWAPYAGLDAVDQGSLQELLKDLVRQRLLTPAKAPAPQAALVFQATLSGAAGNAVTLTVAKVVPDPAKPPDPKNATFDLSVKESAVYPQLSVDAAADNFVADVLGTDADLVSPDGLVHLKAPVADPLPLPKGGTYQLGAGGTQTVAVPQAAAANQTAFTLEARDTDVTAPLTKVVIAD